MIEWFFYGAIFNFFYYWFRLDVFVIKVSLMNLEEAEKHLDSFLDDDYRDKLEEMKKNCEMYSENIEHNIFTVAIDLVIFPFYALALLVSSIDYYFIKDKK